MQSPPENWKNKCYYLNKIKGFKFHRKSLGREGKMEKRKGERQQEGRECGRQRERMSLHFDS